MHLALAEEGPRVQLHVLGKEESGEACQTHCQASLSGVSSVLREAWLPVHVQFLLYYCLLMAFLRLVFQAHHSSWLFWAIMAARA